MEFDRKREAEQQLRDVVPEQQEEHALEVVQTVHNAPGTETDQVEAIIEAMPGVLPLEVWANDLLEDARHEAARRANNELQRVQAPPPVLFSAPRQDVEAPNDPTPYLFSAVRSDDDAFGGDPPAGPPGGGPPGGSGSGLPPPPSDSDDDKPDAKHPSDGRTRNTQHATKSSSHTTPSSPGSARTGTQHAPKRKP